MTPIHDPCPGGGGGGDAFLAATQTWTGVNTYNGKTNFNDLVVVSGTAEAIAGGSELWFKPTGPSGTPFDTDQYRLRVLGTGEMLWGDGLGPQDTSLARFGVAQLLTGGFFHAVDDITARFAGGAGPEVSIGAVGAGGDPGIRFYATGTDWIYRSAGGVLNTDGDFGAGGEVKAAFGTANEVIIGAATLGFPGIKAGDVNLYNVSSGQWRTDHKLDVVDRFRTEGDVYLGNAAGDLLSFHGVTGVAQAAAIAAPSTPSVVYSQAEAQSAVDAINFIIAVLNSATGVGLTA